MKIKAKFKGSNSLGYVNGENYDLWFSVMNMKVWIWRIDKPCRESECPCNSLKSFLNNWQVF